tara:strand:- start:203 stop:526 length:324 start_codon:yes stop_codon:yes gene_type:complete
MMKITKKTFADHNDRMAFVRAAFDMIDSQDGRPNTVRMVRMMRAQGFDATLGEMREVCEWLHAAFTVASLEKLGVRQVGPGMDDAGEPDPLEDSEFVGRGRVDPMQA